MSAVRSAWWRAGTAARLGAATLLVTAVEVALRTVALSTVARVFGVRFVAADSGADGDGAALARVLPARDRRRVEAVCRVVARWPVGGPCLREALAVGAVLRRWHPVVRIGVARPDDGGRLVAHAWVEVAGATYDPTVARYAVLEPA